ncbi:unnamed protein product, partial [Scytosiphon promiscuus]
GRETVFVCLARYAWESAFGAISQGGYEYVFGKPHLSFYEANNGRISSGSGVACAILYIGYIRDSVVGCHRQRINSLPHHMLDLHVSRCGAGLTRIYCCCGLTELRGLCCTERVRPL